MVKINMTKTKTVLFGSYTLFVSILIMQEIFHVQNQWTWLDRLYNFLANIYVLFTFPLFFVRNVFLGIGEHNFFGITAYGIKGTTWYMLIALFLLDVLYLLALDFVIEKITHKILVKLKHHRESQ